MSHFTDLISLPPMTWGRVTFALSTIPDAARAIPAVAGAIEAVQRTAKALGALEHGWRQSRSSSTARGNAAALDAEIDRGVGAVATLARGYVSGLPSDDPAHEAGAKILAKALPEGAAAITRLAYEDELVAVRALVERLRGDLAEEAALIGLERVITTLEALLPQFEAELMKTAEKVNFSQVRAARTTLNEAVAVLVVQILASHAAPDQLEARSAALAPILTQAARVAELRRRRRRVTDVDPQSGVEIEAATDVGEA